MTKDVLVSISGLHMDMDAQIQNSDEDDVIKLWHRLPTTEMENIISSDEIRRSQWHVKNKSNIR